MPVIGRLDGQVDEVLIAPLEKRRRGAGGAPVAERGDATENHDDPVNRAARDEFEKDSARDEVESDAVRDRLGEEAAREELPVWLL